jgi:hypothetical protein
MQFNESKSESAPPPKISQAPPKPPITFHFLTFSDLDGMRDRDTVSQIKKHVMRDIGRSRRRPSKRRQYSQKLPHHQAELQLRLPNSYVSAFQSGGAIDPFVHFPKELNQTDRELTANSELCQAWRTSFVIIVD